MLNKCIEFTKYLCGSNSIGRVPAFQAGCCGFEPRLPLHKTSLMGGFILLQTGNPLWLRHITKFYGSQVHLKFLAIPLHKRHLKCLLFLFILILWQFSRFICFIKSTSVFTGGFMKINAIATRTYSPNFTNALSKKQEMQYLELMRTIDRVRKQENADDGIRVVKLYSPALPSKLEENTGIGKPSSEQAYRFYEMAKIYGGATAIKHMPMGQLTDKQGLEHRYAGAYQRSALTYGEEAIDLFQLASEDYGYILSLDEAEKFKIKHQMTAKDGLIDFNTTLGWKNQQDYPINEPLRIAFDNFKNNQKPSGKLLTLRAEFEIFKNQKEPLNYDDIYTRIALFPYIKDWATGKTDFFVGFDSDINIRMKKMPEYEALKEKYKNEIEFFKFKQFLAHKSIEKSVQIQHKLGLEAMIDCPIAFSWPEEQVFPDAFLKDKWGRSAQVGWGIHAINYPDLIHKQNSPAHKLLKAKIAHCLNLYDGIRLDVGWSYLNPAYHFGDNQKIRLDAGNKITGLIEQTAQEVKGKDFDQRKIMYECDASGDDFNLWANSQKLKGIKGLAILSTEEEKNDSANVGWGNISFLRENIGLDDDDFILGTNNHDKEGVLRCAQNHEKSSEQVGALLRVFNKAQEQDAWKLFKDDEDKSAHLEKYTKARFAEVDLAKHSFLMYTDFLGRADKVDYHGQDNEHDYKIRLGSDFEERYHKALQSGIGYNAADVKCFEMEMDGSAEKYPKLYEAAKKYSEYLKLKGGICTREQAERSKMANVDILRMPLNKIKQFNFIC